MQLPEGFLKLTYGCIRVVRKFGGLQVLDLSTLTCSGAGQ